MTYTPQPLPELQYLRDLIERSSGANQPLAMDLLAEVERLRMALDLELLADVERLSVAMDLLAEVERLRAENAAMREIVEAVASDQGPDDDQDLLFCKRCISHCRRIGDRFEMIHAEGCIIPKARTLLASQAKKQAKEETPSLLSAWAGDEPKALRFHIPPELLRAETTPGTPLTSDLLDRHIALMAGDVNVRVGPNPVDMGDDRYTPGAVPDMVAELMRARMNGREVSMTEEYDIIHTRLAAIVEHAIANGSNGPEARLLAFALHDAEQAILGGLRGKHIMYRDPATGAETPQVFGAMTDTPRQETLLLAMTAWQMMVTSAMYGHPRNQEVRIDMDDILNLLSFIAHHPSYQPSKGWPHTKEQLRLEYASLAIR